MKLDRSRPVTLGRLVQGVGNLLIYYGRSNLWRLKHPVLRKPDNRIPIDRPIFLLGLQGGGLTILSRMLRRNQSVVSVTGNAGFWAGRDEMQNVMGAILPAELTGLFHKIPPYPAYPDRNWTYAVDDLLPLYRKTGKDATDVIAAAYKQVIRIPLSLFASKIDNPRFLDKSQTNTVRVSFVSKLLEGHSPHFVLVTRNPYALCYRSAISVKSISELPISLKEKLELASQQWTNSYSCVFEDITQIPFKTVRFEDLLNEPVDTLQSICQFLGLEFDEDMLPSASHRLPLGSTGSSSGDHKWYPLRPDVNSRYLEALQPWMVDVIHAYVAEFAHRWNYSPEGS